MRTMCARVLMLAAVLSGAVPIASGRQVPVYEVTPMESSVKFGVESSVSIKGSFDKWKASMKFSSTDVRSGV